MKNAKFHIYTGNGKGKTTSVVGMAIRASGHKKKVFLVQFLKHQKTGEQIILNKIENITYKKFGSKDFIINNKITNKHKEEVNKAIEYINKIIQTKKVDLLILDEINIIIYYNLLSISKAKQIIRTCKLKNIELVFTGRYAKKQLINYADLVTEMKEVKHYFLDTQARKGIEY